MDTPKSLLKHFKTILLISRSDHRRHRPLPGSPRLCNESGLTGVERRANKPSSSCDGNGSDTDGHCGAHAARKRKERTISESDKHETKLCRQGSVNNRYDICCDVFMQNSIVDRSILPPSLPSFYSMLKAGCGWNAWWQLASKNLCKEPSIYNVCNISFHPSQMGPKCTI